MNRTAIANTANDHYLTGIILLCLSIWSWCPAVSAAANDEPYADYYKDYFKGKKVHVYTSNYDWNPLARGKSTPSGSVQNPVLNGPLSTKTPGIALGKKTKASIP